MMLNLGCGHKTSNQMINIDFVSDNKNVKIHNLLKPLPYENNTADLIYHSNVLEHFSEKDGKKFIKDNFRVLKPGGILRCVVPDLENAAREYIKIIDECRENKINNKHQWMVIELIDQLNRHKPGGEMSNFLSSEHNIDEYLESRIGSIKGKNTYGNKIVDLSFKRIKRIVQKGFFKLFGPTYELGRFRNGGECHMWMYDELSLTKLLKECGFSKIEKVNAFDSKSSYWMNVNLDIDSNDKPIDPNGLIIEGLKES